jgi:integrase
MCAGLGLRQGEAFGLAVDDVDFLRSVHVRRQVKILGLPTSVRPTEGGRLRDVRLPESVSLRLAAYLQASGPVRSRCHGRRPGSRQRPGSC